MFGRFVREIKEWWNEREEENWFVHNTISELHQKLRVFDLQADFWTYRGLSYVTIGRGEKFPLHPHGKTTYLCTVTLEKKLG